MLVSVGCTTRAERTQALDHEWYVSYITCSFHTQYPLQGFDIWDTSPTHSHLISRYEGAYLWVCRRTEVTWIAGIGDLFLGGLSVELKTLVHGVLSGFVESHEDIFFTSIDLELIRVTNEGFMVSLGIGLGVVRWEPLIWKCWEFTTMEAVVRGVSLPMYIQPSLLVCAGDEAGASVWEQTWVTRVQSGRGGGRPALLKSRASDR